MVDLPYGIHWFRRDLRLAGNSALRANWSKYKGRVVGFFCFDSTFLARPDFSVNRFQFFLETLRALRDELRRAGSDLLIFDVGPEAAFERLFALLSENKSKLPEFISWNRDYEPFARKRDDGMVKFFATRGIPIQAERDHLIIEPNELFRGDMVGETYKIYSPFARRWLDLFNSAPVQARIQEQSQGLAYLDKYARGLTEPNFELTWRKLLKPAHVEMDCLEKYAAANRGQVTIEIPKAGALQACAKVNLFKKRMDDYGGSRDFPAQSGTSHLSCFFKNGSLTTSQVVCALRLKSYEKGAPAGADKFFSELIWREFYYHILFHHPYVEHQAFIPKFRAIEWENNDRLFDAWTNGLTGFPIVDAGMRQLNETGFMHNRVRMIVASFLTKDLLIDWKWGERYFMQTLLDGDLAPNNGGWQWAASTGCDPQPFFRIFNPSLQSKRFDPEGQYIKKYIPELRKVEPKLLHTPEKMSVKNYPKPVIDHSVQRLRALDLFQAAESSHRSKI
jgi:deoxyribodipyrimidine photo-lyase